MKQALAPLALRRTRQSPELTLLKAIPLEIRRQLFPDGMPSVRQITGDVLLREKLRDYMQAQWATTKVLLQWKAANGFCAASTNPLCEQRLTSEDKRLHRQSCSKCADYKRRWAKGEGIRKSTRSSYGLWRQLEKAAETAERRRSGR